MSITTEEHYHGVVIAINGKFLGSIHVEEFKKKIDELKKEGRVHVVVDLGKTEFLDSTGIGTLISGLTSLRNAGGDMRLANLTDRIQGLFLMMRLLGSAFEHYDSVEEALQSFEERPEPKEPAQG
jgi:anti-sigma B factor antagonist